MFDLGITGRDWVEETGADVVTVGELAYSKNSPDPVRVVLCVAQDSPVQRMSDLPEGTRVSTEYPELTRRALEKAGDPGRCEDLLRGDRGEDPRDRRRRGRDHRDRQGAQGCGAARCRDTAYVEDRADRQPGLCRGSRAPARDEPALHLAGGCARGEDQGPAQDERRCGVLGGGRRRCFPR